MSYFYQQGYADALVKLGAIPGASPLGKDTMKLMSTGVKAMKTPMAQTQLPAPGSGPFVAQNIGAGSMPHKPVETPDVTTPQKPPATPTPESTEQGSRTSGGGGTATPA